MESGNFKVEDLVFNESFQRYVLKKTPEDTRYWETWISKNPDALKVINSAKEILTFVVKRHRRPLHPDIRDEVFTRLQNQINIVSGVSLNAPRKIVPVFWKYAASVLMIVGFAAAFLLYRNRQSFSPKDVSQFLEVIVPEGQRSQLVLPDGTRVWLNSGSLFKYPTEFLTKGRDVYLEGEAFFDVKHCDNIPFIVHLKEKLSIRVLGTEFNVKSYDEDEIIETTLIEGSIRLIKEDNSNSKITQIELKPNEKAVFQKQSRSINISHLLAEEPKDEVAEPIQSLTHEKLQNKLEPITAWKEESLVFYNETFEEIAIKMERWYGLKINVSDESLKKERFTGKFANKENIYQVLDIFNRSEPIQYQTKNQEIVIHKKYKP